MFGIKWLKNDNHRLSKCVIAQKEEITRLTNALNLARHEIDTLQSTIKAESMLRSNAAKNGWETRRGNK